MNVSRPRFFMAVGVVLAVGCGGGKPQDAAATPESAKHTDHPIVLAEATTSAQPATSGASIRGTITFQGTAPVAERVKMDADPVCQQQHATPVSSEEVVVNSNGTLKNVFVYVKDGAKGPFAAPTTRVALTQSGCWYTPHVFGIQAGQPLEIVNDDATLHNVNAKPTMNQPFNVAQPVKGMKTTKKFDKPEVMVKFKCNVHPWMNAYAGVVDSPFFSVSGADGTFTITGLSAGTYTIEAWHEKYGAQTQTVTVGSGDTQSIAFTFKGQ